MQIAESSPARTVLPIEEEAIEHRIVEWSRKLRDVGMHLLFFLPLVFSPDYTLNLFELPKSTAMALFTILTAASGLAYILLRGHFRLRRTVVDLPLLVLLAVSVLSTIASVSPIFSLYGEWGRRDGLLTLANYALLFFMAVSYFTEWRRIRRASEIMAVVAVFVALIGILETLGFSIHLPGIGKDFQGRAFSTLGNPDFLGAYLVLLAPLPIGLLVTARSRSAKLLWSLAFLLLSLGLILTLTRGALIGFVASLLFLLLFVRSLRPHLVWVVGLLVVVGVIGVFVGGPRLAARMTDAPASTHGTSASEVSGVPPEQPGLQDRVRSLIDRQGLPVQVRFETWRQALDIVRDHPWLGTGLNTYQMMASRYYSPAYAAGEGSDHMPDRPHNQYLQWAAFAGIPGLVAYLGVLGAIFWCWVRWLRRNSRDRRLLLVAIMAGWVGYLVQNFFLFDTILTAPQFWLLTALGVAITGPSVRHVRLWPSRTLSWAAWPITGLVALVSLYLVFLVVRPVVADVLFFNGQKMAHLPGGGWSAVRAGYAQMEEAIAWMPDEQYYREIYVLTVEQGEMRPGYSEQDKARDLAVALRVITQAIRNNPVHAALYFDRGTLYDRYDDNRVIDAFNDYTRAAELEPYSLPANLGLAQTARMLGKTMEGIAAERRILIVYPDRLPTLIDLAQDYLAVGRFDEVQSLIRRIAAVDPSGPDAEFLQGRVYEVRGALADAEAAFTRALERRADFKPAQAGLERLKNPTPQAGRDALGMSGSTLQSGGDPHGRVFSPSK